MPGKVPYWPSPIERSRSQPVTLSKNHTLEKVASPKYLGLELTEKLHWSKETNCKGDYTQCVCLENYESMFQLHPGSLVQRPSPTSPGVYIGGMGSQSATTEVRSASASAMVVQLNLENLENCWQGQLDVQSHEQPCRPASTSWDTQGSLPKNLTCLQVLAEKLADCQPIAMQSRHPSLYIYIYIYIYILYVSNYYYFNH